MPILITKFLEEQNMRSQKYNRDSLKSEIQTILVGFRHKLIEMLFNFMNEDMCMSSCWQH